MSPLPHNLAGNDRSDRKRVGHSRRVLLGASLAALLAGTSLAPANSHAQDQVSTTQAALSGIWLVDQGSNVAKAMDGSPPPLNARGSKLVRQRQAAKIKGDITWDKTTWCASPGLPRLMLIHYPFEIIVRPQAVFFHYQWDRWTRFVDMGGDDLPVVDPSSMGVSIGKWDGDTLVIRSYGLRDDTLLDNAGLPHSADAKLTERVRLVNHDTLEDMIHIEDPAFYAKPWTIRVTYKRQSTTEIDEDVCLDRVSGGQPAIADK